MEMTMRLPPAARISDPLVMACRRQEDGLRRVLFQIDFFRQGHDFARVVVTAGAADVVRALEFAAIRAFRRVSGNKRVVGATHVAARFRDSVLRDSHVSTSGSGDMPQILHQDSDMRRTTRHTGPIL
jgi:hypothetical protein